MNYVKSAYIQKIQIPVIEAEINLVTTDYKNLNKYTYFLLNLLYDGNSIECIEELTQFNRWQIENELEVSSKYGLVSKSEHEFLISNLGIDVIKRSREIDIFNNRKEKVLIDKLTGAILKKDANYKKVHNRNYKVVKDNYKNINPCNSKEYFIDNYGAQFEEVNIEEIDIELILGEEYWIEFEISNFKTVIEYEEANGISNIKIKSKDIYCIENIESCYDLDKLIIRGKVYKINYRFENSELNMYRHSIDSLKQLSILDNELLSDKAKNIIDLYEEELMLNERVNLIYFDSISGLFNNTRNLSNEKIRRKSMAIELNEIIKFEDISEGHLIGMINILDEKLKFKLESGRYKLNYSLVDEIAVTKEVPHEIIYEGVGLC